MAEQPELLEIQQGDMPLEEPLFMDPDFVVDGRYRNIRVLCYPGNLFPRIAPKMGYNFRVFFRNHLPSPRVTMGFSHNNLGWNGYIKMLLYCNISMQYCNKIRKMA